LSRPRRMDEPMAGSSLSKVLQDILALKRRRPLEEWLLGKAVESAARASVECYYEESTDILEMVEDTRKRAGKALGLPAKATPVEIQIGLRNRGRNDLAKSFAEHNRGRRVVAHPNQSLPEEIETVLGQPAVRVDSTEELVDAPPAGSEKIEATISIKEDGTDTGSCCTDVCNTTSCSHCLSELEGDTISLAGQIKEMQSSLEAKVEGHFVQSMIASKTDGLLRFLIDHEVKLKRLEGDMSCLQANLDDKFLHLDAEIERLEAFGTSKFRHDSWKQHWK